MKQPKKVIINNPYHLPLERYNIDLVISEAVLIRNNQRYDSSYLSHGGRILDSNRIEIEYSGGVVIQTFFRKEILTINVSK